jgi:hypothetical protein
LNHLLVLALLILHLLRRIGLLALLPAAVTTDLIAWCVIPSQGLSADAYT